MQFTGEQPVNDRPAELAAQCAFGPRLTGHQGSFCSLYSRPHCVRATATSQNVCLRTPLPAHWGPTVNKDSLSPPPPPFFYSFTWVSVATKSWVRPEPSAR